MIHTHTHTHANTEMYILSLGITYICIIEQEKIRYNLWHGYVIASGFHSFAYAERCRSILKYCSANFKMWKIFSSQGIAKIADVKHWTKLFGFENDTYGSEMEIAHLNGIWQLNPYTALHTINWKYVHIASKQEKFTGNVSRALMLALNTICLLFFF